jgi:hypothetical protein
MMVSYKYHYWIRVLLQHLKLTDRPFAWDLRNVYEGGAVVAIKETQTVTVRAKGKSPARRFEAGTTMRLDDPTSLVIDGFEDGDFGSMNVGWERSHPFPSHIAALSPAKIGQGQGRCSRPVQTISWAAR